MVTGLHRRVAIPMSSLFVRHPAAASALGPAPERSTYRTPTFKTREARPTFGSAAERIPEEITPIGSSPPPAPKPRAFRPAPGDRRLRGMQGLFQRYAAA